MEWPLYLKEKQKTKLMFKILNKCTQEYLQNPFKRFTTENKLRDKANKLLYPSPVLNSLNKVSATVGPICGIAFPITQGDQIFYHV